MYLYRIYAKKCLDPSIYLTNPYRIHRWSIFLRTNPYRIHRWSVFFWNFWIPDKIIRIRILEANYLRIHRSRSGSGALMQSRPGLDQNIIEAVWFCVQEILVEYCLQALLSHSSLEEHCGQLISALPLFSLLIQVALVLYCGCTRYFTVFWIYRIHMFLGLPDPDPLVWVDPNPDTSIIKQK